MRGAIDQLTVPIGIPDGAGEHVRAEIEENGRETSGYQQEP